MAARRQRILCTVTAPPRIRWAAEGMWLEAELRRRARRRSATDADWRLLSAASSALLGAKAYVEERAIQERRYQQSPH